MKDFAIDLRQVVDRATLLRDCREWHEFCDRPGTQGGVWCDPRVVEQVVKWDAGEDVVLVQVRDESDAPVAWLPFRRMQSRVPFFIGLWRVGRMDARVLRLVDGDFVRTRNVDTWTVLTCVLTRLHAQGGTDVIMASNCRLPSDRADAARVAIRHPQDTYLVDMPGSFEDYVDTLSSKTRQTIRRKVRRMGREHAIKVRCFRTASDVTELSAALEHVWRLSWHGNLGRQRPPAVEFLGRLAEQGWLRSYVMTADGEPVASVLGFQYKGTFLDEAPAFVQSVKKWSPGIVLFWHVFEDLFRSDPPACVDFGFGYNQYKETLGSRSERRAEVWSASSPRGRLIVGAARTSDALYRAGKRLLGNAAVRSVKRRIRARQKPRM